MGGGQEKGMRRHSATHPHSAGSKNGADKGRRSLEQKSPSAEEKEKAK